MCQSMLNRNLPVIERFIIKKFQRKVFMVRIKSVQLILAKNSQNYFGRNQVAVLDIITVEDFNELDFL